MGLGLDLEILLVALVVIGWGLLFAPMALFPLLGDAAREAEGDDGAAGVDAPTSLPSGGAPVVPASSPVGETDRWAA